MNKKILFLIVPLTAIALIGLVTIQINWINQSYTIKEQRFNQSVHNALNNTAIRLERIDAYNYMERQNSLSVNDMFNTFFHGHLSEKGLLENDQEINMQISDTADGFADLKGKVIFQDSSKGGKQITVSFDTSFTVFEDGKKYSVVQKQWAKYNNMFQSMAFDMLFRDLPLKKRIGEDEVTQVLESELKANGVTTAYNYALIEPDLGFNRLVYSNTDKIGDDFYEASYKMPVFNNAVQGRQALLLINFPNQKRTILSSLWTMLFSSSLFILIIVFCFGATLYIIFQQKKLSDMKTDFINNMTHELKTPVATISLATEMLQKDQVIKNKEKIDQYSGIIQDENKRLSGHIEKVLQAAKLEKQELQLAINELDINNVILDVIEKAQLNVKDAEGRIEFESHAERSIIEGDPAHITNVVSNLVDNAIKYSKDKPDVRVKTSNKNGGIVLSVIDKGIGMSREATKKIFDKFYRVGTGNVHDVKGFGLGLSYVKAIVEEHGGKIHVKSELNAGSEFSIYLPFTHKYKS